jgi:hypothetical protein
MDKVAEQINYYTLTFGATINKCIEEIQEKLGVDFQSPSNGARRIGVDSLYIGQLSVMNFPGDCGTLIIRNIYQPKDKDLLAVEKYASISGFSNIVGTLVSESPEIAEDTFRRLGWNLVDQGMSNRNDYKHSMLVCKTIDCEKKGY